MTKRPAKNNPLPEWFNLSKYDQLFDITNLSLINEISLRIMALEKNEEIQEESIYLDAWNEMSLSGAVILYEFYKISMRTFSDTRTNDTLSKRLESIHTHMIKPSPTMADPYSRQMRPLFSTHIYPSEWLATLSANSQFTSNLVHVGIRLSDATDAEILTELTRLLPVWREHLTMPEPAKNEAGKAGASTIKRIIEYRVIPMLDLMLWTKIKGVEYSAEQLSRVLFQEDLVTAKQMTDTRIPFALNFSNIDYFDMMCLWLRQAGADGKINGHRLVRDELPVT